MNNLCTQGNTGNKRIEYLDTLRGWCALFVMTVHTGIEGGANTYLATLVSSVMLQGFFFVSGAVYKQDKFVFFLKKRILKLWICQIVLAYTEVYLSTDVIINIIRDHRYFLNVFVERTTRIIQGEAIWFITALILTTLISYPLIWIVNKYKVNSLYIIIISVAISVTAYYLLVERGRHMPYYIDSALVNQFYFILGYIYLKEDGFRYLRNNVLKIAIVSLNLILIAILYRGTGFAGFSVREGIYNNIYQYISIGSLSVFSLLSICMIFDRVPLITFMGKHSLFYFAFGPKGYQLARLIEKIKYPLSMNISIRKWLYALIGSLAMVIPAMIADRFFPILNGHIDFLKTNKYK